MNDDQFTKLFRYVETRFGDMDKRFDEMATKDSVDRLAASVDALIGHYKERQAEQAARVSNGIAYLNGLVKSRKRPVYR